MALSESEELELLQLQKQKAMSAPAIGPSTNPLDISAETLMSGKMGGKMRAVSAGIRGMGGLIEAAMPYGPNSVKKFISDLEQGKGLSQSFQEGIDVFGDEKASVPSVQDLISGAGVPLLKPSGGLLSGMYSDRPSGLQFKKGGAFDPSVTELAAVYGAGKLAAGKFATGAPKGLIGEAVSEIDQVPGLIKKVPGAAIEAVTPEVAPTSPKAQARIDAFKSLGISEDKIPAHLLTDDEILLRRADTLATDPWAGGEAYRKAMDPVTGAINQKAASLLDEATGMPPHELGSRVQKEVKAVADKLAKDFGEAYDLEHEIFGSVPASKSSMRNLSKTIQSLADEPGMDDASLRLINKAQRDLEKIKTVDDLKKLKTNLSNSLSDRPTGNEKRVIGQLSDAIQRTRQNSIKLSTKKTSYPLEGIPDQVKEIPDISTASPLEIRKGLLEGGGKPQVSYQKIIGFETPNGDSYRIYLNNDNRVSVLKNSLPLTEPPTHDLSTFGPGKGPKKIKPGGVSIAELPKFLSSLDEDGEVARAFSNAIKERTVKTKKPFGELSDLAERRAQVEEMASGKNRAGVSDKKIYHERKNLDEEIGEKIQNMSDDELLSLDTQALSDSIEKLKRITKSWRRNDDLLSGSNKEFFLSLMENKIVGKDGADFLTEGPRGSVSVPAEHVSSFLSTVSKEMAGDALYKALVKSTEEIPGISLSMKNKTVATKFWDRVLSDRQFAMGPDEFTRTRKIGNYTFNELVDEARKKSGEIRIRTADGVDLGRIKKEELPKWIAENDKDFSVAKALQKGGYSDIKKKVTFDKEALKPGKELNKMYREGAGLIKKGLGYETKRKEGLLGPVNRLLEEEPSMVRKRLVSTRNPDQNIAFMEAFPEQWDVLRRGELARIKAQVSTKEGKAINPVSLVNELFGSSRGEPRYHPDVLKQIFGPEKYQELLALKEAVESLPKNYNPSGSAKQAAFLSHLLNPKESAKSLANYGLLKAKSPKGLIKPKKGE